MLGAGGHHIPGDLGEIHACELRSVARYVLVVEKDAVFNKLAQERVFDTLPVVLVTAKVLPRGYCPPRHRHALRTLES